MSQFYTKLQSTEMRFGYQWKILSLPGVPPGDEVFMSSAAKPGRTLTPAETTYHAFKLKLPGTVNYEGSWSTTIKCTNDMKIYNAINKLINEYAPGGEESKKGNAGKHTLPTVDGSVQLLGADLVTPVSTYKFYGIFPTSIGEITLDQTNTDIVTFTVEWAYQYWEVV